MIQVFQISEQEIEAALQDQEFPLSVREKLPNTAIISTQDWCPDWKAMQQWLLEESRTGSDNEEDIDVAVGVIIYNKQSYQNSYMRMKERSWKNALIPYVRYYHNAHLVSESNRVSRKEFLSRFPSAS